MWFWGHLHSYVHKIPTQMHPFRLGSVFYIFLTVQNFLCHSETSSKLFRLSPSFYPNSSYIILSCPAKRTQQYKLLLPLWLNNGNSTKDPFGKISFYNSWSYMELISSSVTKVSPFLSLSLLFPIFHVSFSIMWEREKTCERGALKVTFSLHQVSIYVYFILSFLISQFC